MMQPSDLQRRNECARTAEVMVGKQPTAGSRTAHPQNGRSGSGPFNANCPAGAKSTSNKGSDGAEHALRAIGALFEPVPRVREAGNSHALSIPRFDAIHARSSAIRSGGT